MFHFIPFLTGAAAGAALTYLVKDPQARVRIRSGAEQFSDQGRR